MSDKDKYSDDGIVCPHCEHLHEQQGFEAHEYTDGEYDCHNCEMSFDFCCDISYSWTSVVSRGFEL